MTEPSSVSSFDITTADGCRGVAERHVSIPRDDALSVNEVEDGLRSLVQYLGRQPWMTWQWGAFSIPTGHRSTRVTNAGEAAQLGLDLAAVAHCDNFGELLKGFANPTQFDDSMFEVRMARWCLERRAVRSLRFGPTYIVRGHVKRPDFEIATPIGLIVCECKRLHLGTGDLMARLGKISKAFDEAIKALGLGEDVRLEVEIQHRIAGDLAGAARDACAAIMASPVGQVLQVGPFSIARSEVGKPPLREMNGEVQSGRIRVGATAVGATPEYTYLLISSPWMERAISRAMGSLVNSALRQLPPHRHGIIFVSGSRRYGNTAAEARLLDPAYDQCLAIATVHGHDVNLTRRTIDEATISWLFADRRPTWGDRIKLLMWWRLGLRSVALGRSEPKASI
jgi:hypothetical protein